MTKKFGGRGLILVSVFCPGVNRVTIGICEKAMTCTGDSMRRGRCGEIKLLEYLRESQVPSVWLIRGLIDADPGAYCAVY